MTDTPTPAKREALMSEDERIVREALHAEICMYEQRVNSGDINNAAHNKASLMDAKIVLDAFNRLNAPSSQAPRELRDKISEILVRNNLRSDQVAIGELVELLQPRAQAEGTEDYKPHYYVEIETDGCKACGHGKMWWVVGPDEIAEGIVFENEDEAQEYADKLNTAFLKGERHALASRQNSALEWQPIETAPKTGRILLWYPCYKFPQIGWWNEAEKQFEEQSGPNEKPYIAPSHWMHLPKRPEEK